MKRFFAHFSEKKSFQFFSVVGGICVIYLLLGTGLFFLFEKHSIDPLPALFLADSDSKEYFLLAENIRNHLVFSESGEAPFVKEALRTPGYPFFLAILLSLFKSLYSVILAQITLVALTAFFIFKIGEKIHSQALGIASATLYVIDPTTLYHTFTAFSDIFFVFLFVTTIYFLFFIEQRREKIRYIGIGVMMGAAILVRPIALFIIPFLCLAHILIKNDSLLRLRTYLPLFFFTLGTALIIVPWSARNYVHFGTPNLSSIGAYNLLFYNTVEFLSTREGVTAEKIRDKIKGDLGNPERDILRSPSMTGIYKEKVNEYLEGQKSDYLLFHFAKTIPFFVGSSIDIVESAVRGHLFLAPKERGSGNLSTLLFYGDIKNLFKALNQQGLLILLERLLWAFLLLGAILATFLAKERRLIALLFLGIIFYYALLTGPVSFPRYRLPAEPFLLLGGLWGISLLHKHFFPYQKPHERVSIR